MKNPLESSQPKGIQKVDLSSLTTEKESKYHDIENMSVAEIIDNINKEDRVVPEAVHKAREQIRTLVEETIRIIENGGRIFYIGAGTSGRLGVVDASECPPTFGVDPSVVVGIIAGGDVAIRKAVEGAEDSTTQGWEDLQTHNISINDIVIGIAASGRTPYVVEALKKCREQGIKTGSIVSNLESEMAKHSDFPIEVVLGPEFISGSSRMKSGTAQKLILNTITTATFAKTGGVIDNKMARMRVTNKKLEERAIQNVMKARGVSHEEAIELMKGKSMEDLLKNPV